MKQLKLQPNVGTYELLFSLFGNVNAPYEEGNMLSQVDVARRIKAIEMDMMNNGIQHSHLSMKNLVCPYSLCLLFIFTFFCYKCSQYCFNNVIIQRSNFFLFFFFRFDLFEYT